MPRLWAWPWGILTMINLLPTEEKKKNATVYRFHVLVLSFEMAGICFFIAGAALLPSYFLSSAKERSALQKLELLKNTPVTMIDQNTLDSIKDINSKISIMEGAEKDRFSVLGRVINEMISKKMPDIKISQITYVNDSKGLKKVSVRGLALNRERLLIFREMLESDPIFSKVDLPISNFIKGQNIDFSLNLTTS